MKKIKILYLITGLNVGGAEVLLWKLIKDLDKEKFEPVVVSIIPIGEIGKRIQQEGIKILSLNITKVLTSKNKEKFSSLIFRSIITIFKEIPHLVFITLKEKPKILHSFLFHANFLGRITGKICRVPIIISSIHSMNFGGKLREKLLRYTDNLCDLTIAVSQMVAKTMTEKRVVPKQKLKVIYNGIELEDFDLDKNIIREEIRKELGIRSNQNILISVGRLAKEKGYSYMIKTIQILKKKYPDLIWIVLGDGEDRRKLEREVKTSNLQKNVFFLGNRNNVAEYLIASNVFLMPSLEEGLPLALLEAMVCGLPIVATNVGGIPEVITDGANGFLVEPKNSLALAKKIEYLLNLEQERRKKIGLEGRKVVEEKFSLEKMERDYKNLYQQFLSKLR